jgi:hypothetical protein
MERAAMTRQEIRATIEGQGLNAYFRENVSKKGDGTSKVYVQACKYVRRCGNVHIALGPIEQVAQMSQGELVEAVQQKFAEKLRVRQEALQGK